ncbi:DUF883 family protein [Ideonella azotifigens]|nr:DUF883 family protein [Ideonella azotifigens]MCD2344239.1 DUF883 family protein [Ideonella azotifigens]
MDAINASATAVQERLANTLHGVVSEAEALLKTAQHGGSEQFAAARDQLEARVRRARSELADLEDSALRKARRAVRATDRAVQDHPYTTAGLLAGVGLLIGVLIARR